MKNSSIRLSLAIILLLLFGIACQAPDVLEESQPTQPETAPQTCSSGNVLKIGAAVSASGTFSREGEEVRRGYSSWADFVNNTHGGIKIEGTCYTVEMIYYDDESDPELVDDLIEKLITEDEVKFLLGPFSSRLTAPASAVSERFGMIMVEGTGASETLFTRGFENLFAVVTPAGNFTQSSLEVLATEGAKTVVIAYEDTLFPTSVGVGAIKWAEEYGMEVLAVEAYPQDIDDVSEIMTKFRDLNPDVFVGGGHFNDALLFVATADALDFSPQGMVLTVGP
ncbi:MAG: amino acid ABC transporter substrate-binding protein, partial [Chloroflexota bacterium]